MGSTHMPHRFPTYDPLVYHLIGFLKVLIIKGLLFSHGVGAVKTA